MIVESGFGETIAPVASFRTSSSVSSGSRVKTIVSSISDSTRAVAAVRSGPATDVAPQRLEDRGGRVAAHAEAGERVLLQLLRVHGVEELEDRPGGVEVRDPHHLDDALALEDEAGLG